VLAAALENDTPRARAAAAQALAYVDAPEASAALRHAVQDADPWVRYFSASSLGRKADAAALPLLETLARGDRLEHVRLAAVDAIGALGGSAAAGVLGVLADAEDAALAAAALRSLGAVNDESALEPLRRARPRPTPGGDRRGAGAGAAPAVPLLRWRRPATTPTSCTRRLSGLHRIGSSRPTAAR
jgi:HEAT repeat protein